MEWLSQDWVWILVIVGGALWLLSRRRHGSMPRLPARGAAHQGPAGATGANAGADAVPDQHHAPTASGHRHRGGCC